MRKLLLFALILFTATQCHVRKGVYERDGLTFVVPDGWKVSMQIKNDAIQYAMASRKGNDNLATWEVYRMNGVISVNQGIQIVAQEMSDNFIFTDYELGRPTSSQYQNRDAVRYPFRYRILGLPQRGFLYGYRQKGYTIIVMLDAPDEEWLEVMDDYDLLENTLEVK